MKRTLGLLLLGTILVGACGSDDDGGAGASGAALCQRAVSKFTGCGFQVEGDCSDVMFEPDTECSTRCFVQAQCATLEFFLCDEGSFDSSDPAIDCMLECQQNQQTFQCADGSGEYTESDKCDGFQDCDDSSDEADCPMIACDDGSMIPESSKCDGLPDCTNAEDEDNCGGDSLPDVTCPGG